MPQNLDIYFLEVSLITVSQAGQYYWHVNKFQLYHKDINAIDSNPCFIPLTAEQLEAGEIA